MNPLKRLIYSVEFISFYAWEVILSNLKVAWDVVTPTHHMKPAIVSIPLDDLTERQIFVLANLITMTPGTLSLDVSADRQQLYIHAMYAEDPVAYTQSLRDDYVKRVLRVF